MANKPTNRTMNDTPTPRTDEWGTISKEDGHWSSHKRRERWIKTAPLKTLEELQTELTAVTEQRDSIDSMYHKVIKEVLECDPIPACKREDDQLEPPWEVIARMREQRGRLAEALRQCREDSVELLGERNWWKNEPRLGYQKRYQETRDNVTRADEALQPLNQDHTVATNDMIAAMKGGCHE